jgi:hypothetical protein
MLGRRWRSTETYVCYNPYDSYELGDQVQK